MTFPTIRSRAGIAGVTAAIIAASGAGAATVHRLAVTQGTGSLGATSFTQTGSSSSALQGEVNASPNTGLKIPFGVLGEYDAPGTTFGTGVIGLSTTGYGVGAETLSANAALLALNAGSGNGIEAYSRSTSDQSSALFAENTGGGPSITATGANNGIVSTSTGNGFAAIDATSTNAQNGTGVFGGSVNGFGVYGYSAGQPGVLASSDSGSGNVPALQTFSTTSGTELFDAHVYGTDKHGYTTASITFPSYGASSTIMNSVGASSDFELNGDVLITGNVFTECPQFPNPLPANCHNATAQSVARTSTGAYVREYSGAHTRSTIEDAGESQLINGYAHVVLEPTFASAISTHKPYLVFTTPQGDGPGLFVTHRTATGFDVRQSLGGRSNMAFDYRILAQPFGATDERMAVVKPQAAGHLMPDSDVAAARLRMALKMAHAKHAIVHGNPRTLISSPNVR